MKTKQFVVVVLSLVLLLTACGPSKENQAINSMNLEEIVSKVTENINDMPECETIQVVAEYYPSFLFIDYIEGSEALTSEALMSSVAHSIVVLKLPEGSDVEAIRSEIEKKADPMKWVCVSAEKVEVVAKGNVILLVMSYEDIVKQCVENFNNIK